MKIVKKLILEELWLLLFFGMFFIPIVSAIDISTCSVLTSQTTYYLTTDIVGSTEEYCIKIITSNVTLDCQNHTIDGIDATSTYGIIIYGAHNNVTIKNCVVTDWYYGVYLMGSSHLATKIIANSNAFNIVLDTATNSIVSDSIAMNGDRGFYLHESDDNLLTNLTSKSNSYNIDFHTSNNNTLTFTRIEDGVYYGFQSYSPYAYTNKIYNNFFKNLNNYAISGALRVYSLNTTRQAGTRIYSAGTEIGGNYWSNLNGTGFSDTCDDLDKDGFCDGYYTVAPSFGHIDYLPLSDEYLVPPSPVPSRCRVCNPELLGAGLIQYFYKGICLLMNLIVCNPILLTFFFIVWIAIFMWKEIKKGW